MEFDGSAPRCFVNASFDEALRRGSASDAEQFGGQEKVRQRYARRYHAASRMYIGEVNPADAADFIIDNDDPSSPRLYRNSMLDQKQFSSNR